MQIQGMRVQREDVKIEVRPSNVWAELRRQIMAANGMSNVEYLRYENDRPVFKQDDPDHRHGSISEVTVIANPTKEQLNVWMSLLAIDNEIKRVEAHTG